MATNFSKETYLYWYELMQLIRQFELLAEEKYKMEGKIRGFFHAYIGQEAIAAGCMTATRPEDPFITGYRDHGLAIAKGVDVKACMAELYGKATGCAKGKGGSMHFFGTSLKFFGGHGIVGAQIGTGAGLAFAEKYNGTDNACLTFLVMELPARECCMKCLTWPCYGNYRLYLYVRITTTRWALP